MPNWADRSRYVVPIWAVDRLVLTTSQSSAFDFGARADRRGYSVLIAGQMMIAFALWIVEGHLFLLLEMMVRFYLQPTPE